MGASGANRRPVRFPIMSTQSDRRPDNREIENENLKPAGEGETPRPATEPAGSAESSRRRDPAPNEVSDPAGSPGSATREHP